MLLFGLAGCTEHQTTQDVPFEMMPNGLKKSVEAELIEKMKQEVIAHHKELHELYSREDYFEVNCWGYPNTLFIDVNVSGQIMLLGEIVSKDEIKSIVKRFYLSNEGLTSKQAHDKIQDPSYRYKNYPFYSRITKPFIQKEIEKYRRELAQVKGGNNEDFIKFYEAMLLEWKQKLKTINTLKTEELVEIHPQTQIRIDDDFNTSGFSESTAEAIKAFIEIRDYAAKKYFNRSYMDLYFHGTRYTNSEDRKKLDAIDHLYEIRITDFSYAELNDLRTGRVLEEQPLSY